MKKTLLLGTTALVAAGFAVSGVAQAEEPISAGISGYYKAALGLSNQDDADGEAADNNDSIALGQDLEISIGGSTTLDNGLTAGFNAQIEGNNGGATVDEKHIFVSGGFGTITVGATEGARQTMVIFAPNGNGTAGVNSEFFQFANMGGAGNVQTYTDGIGNEDGLKLMYKTPNFNGVQLGISYMPQSTEAGQYGGNTADTVGDIEAEPQLALSVTRDLGGISVSGMVCMEKHTLQTCNASPATQTCNDSPETTQIGGKISMGAWAVGGGWQGTDQITQTTSGTNREREDADLGISYGSGNYSVGLLYGGAQLEQTDGSNDAIEIYEINASYVLGPGIDIGAALRRAEVEDGSTTLDNSASVFKSTLSLSF